jgi:hypothetical protein
MRIADYGLWAKNGVYNPDLLHMSVDVHVFVNIKDLFNV